VSESDLSRQKVDDLIYEIPVLRIEARGSSVTSLNDDSFVAFRVGDQLPICSFAIYQYRCLAISFKGIDHILDQISRICS